MCVCLSVCLCVSNVSVCTLQDLLNRVESFQQEAQAALQDEMPNSEKLHRLLEIGVGLDVELPEMPKLKQVSISLHSWFVGSCQWLAIFCEH